MRFAQLVRSTLIGVLVVGLAGCAADKTGGGSGAYKVGNPYQISGVWYYPKEDQFYDETGIASWYGQDFHGKATANGERYDMNALTAAHRTLPMPVIVRVTNLENGRAIRLRLNDRGPYARGRVIDVSRRAAQLLGFHENGTARVRVQYEGKAEVGASPPQDEDEISAGPASIKAAPVSTVSSSELAPPPGAATASARPPAAEVRVASTTAMALPPAEGVDGVVTTVPVPSSTQIWVQVGAFLTRGNADRLAQRLVYAGGARVTQSAANGKAIYRVRFGPYTTVEQADSMLNTVIDKGHNGAQIVVE
ncbi:MAG: septal ring lytic transglycosylase RlpA family protein [Alphaproteobacteria bacterium]|nr:septal ring lytic transglycosylase RlpA family protein [Alphaproteobacteria bacterium]